MPRFTYQFSVKAHDDTPLKEFQFFIHEWGGAQTKFANEPVLVQPGPTSVSFDIDPKFVGNTGKITIWGPMLQSDLSTINYVHIVSVPLTPDLTFD